MLGHEFRALPLLPGLLMQLSVLPASAQEMDTAAAQPLLEEVLVTARKRVESLQEIPVSVSALDETALQRRDVRSLEELAGSTTGLVFENYSTSGLSAAPVIRGMSLTFATAREQNTSVFLDGIYLQRQSMLNPGLHEMQRVEVVKGPQSALYGRNAFAGAINYVTKKPSVEPSGTLEFTRGSDEREDVSASISGALIPDRVLGRLAYSTSEYDGHTDNDHPFADLEPSGDNTSGKLGGWDDEMLSAVLAFSATERMHFNLAYFRNQSKREPQPFYNLDGARQVDNENPENTLNCLDTTTNTRPYGPVLTVPVNGFHAWCGELDYRPPHRDDLAAEGFNRQVLVDPRSFALSADTELWIAAADWQISDSLELSYLYGLAEHEGAGTGVQADFKSTQGDNIAPFNTPTTAFNSNPEEELEATSHELQLSWHGDGTLRVRGGLYYSNVQDSSWNTFWFVAPCNSEANCRDGVTTSEPVLMDTMPPGNGHGKRGNLKHYDDDIYAVFAEVSYDLASQLTLGLEARYTREEKQFHQETTSFGTPLVLREEDTFNYFTPRLTAQYHWRDARMLYASLGKGVKTGGFNTYHPDENPGQAIYEAEENWALELGSKNTLLDGRWQLNLAAFYIDWSNQQGTESARSSNAFASDVIGNIGDVKVTGVEFETTFYFNPAWFVDAGFTYNNPEFTSGAYSPAVNDTNSAFGCDDVTCPADGDVTGNILQRASKRQASLGLNYRAEWAGWSLNARVDGNYRSKMYATPLNLAHNGSRVVSNASFSVSSEHWQFSLWGKNILDKKYVANTFVLPSFSGYLVTLGPRRSWGFNARYSF